MSSWDSIAADLNAAMIDEFATGVAIIFTPQDGSGAQPIQAIPYRPAIEDDYPPGFGPGTPVLRLWVNFETITPSPRRGDQLTFGGVAYMVEEVKADHTGGAILQLRIT